LHSVLYAIYRSYFYVDFCFRLFLDTYESFVRVAALIFMAVVAGLELLSSHRIFLSCFISFLSYRFVSFVTQPLFCHIQRFFPAVWSIMLQV